ncbi:recombinase family protein [Flavobacterium sp. Arc3]|uniref:recombinase family protein n=1 Tax=Flavobacterium sp. Arc3 TaxID=3046686 RepID=UPI00352C3EDD
MAKVKYNRISGEEQNSSRQEMNAKDFAKLYLDKISGSTKFRERKEAKKLLHDIEIGFASEIHITSIDRLGRDIIDILTMVEFFNEKSINLFVENIGMFSLIENKPNPSFKMIISVLGNVAEMERLNMLERQRNGIQARKALGLYSGRLYGTSMTNEEILKKYKTVVKELKNGESLRRAAKIGGCSLGTAQKVQKLISN